MPVATNPKPNTSLQYLGFEALRQRYEAARKGRGASFFKIKKLQKQVSAMNFAHLRDPPLRTKGLNGSLAEWVPAAVQACQVASGTLTSV